MVIPSSNQSEHNSKALLLLKAREEFAQKGYSEASTTEIVESAKVTRGALYYHFKDKKHLFTAVYQTVSQELLENIKQRIDHKTNAWDKLSEAFLAFFDHCANPSIYRIIFEDASLVLDINQRLAMDEKSVLGLLIQLIEESEKEGYISPPSARALTHHLKGAIQETAYLMTHHPEDTALKKEAVSTFMYMLNSMKK